jgi:hypothetical protein
MDTSEHTRNQNSLQAWYEYATQQSWAVDACLRLVRLHDFKTQEQQRNEFGATPEEFLHLQAMHSPREDSFAVDARRIAQARHLQNPDAFVQTMLLARQLALSTQASVENDAYYQAAFDAVDDLDSEIPDELGDK